jgi:hypothetical protein
VTFPSYGWATKLHKIVCPVLHQYDGRKAGYAIGILKKSGPFTKPCTNITRLHILMRFSTVLVPSIAILCVHPELWCVRGRTALTFLASMPKICASGTLGLRITEPLIPLLTVPTLQHLSDSPKLAILFIMYLTQFALLKNVMPDEGRRGF